ncbi:MAG: signal peptidase I [Sandaracinaceae bacterium]|nr:signal peptidase I [Sandaracinaceae bacterium]
MGDSLRGQLLKLFGVVVLLLVIVGAILRYTYVDVVTVNDDAMAPTIFGGDSVLVWRTTDFDHGDVILCRHPRQQGAWVIGRIIGRPGMAVRIDREQLVINNQRVDRDFQGELRFEDQQNHNMSTYAWGYEALGEVHHLFWERPERAITMRPVERSTGFYLLSDNRTWIGGDSRALGPLAHHNCVGVVFMRWSPGGRAPGELGEGYLDILD